MHARLVSIAGPLKGATVSLTVGKTTIGRDLASDVVVGDSRVSRRHSVVAVDDRGECRISDLDSANGTLVNGVPIREVLLKEGDVIDVGGALFVFTLPAAEAPVVSTLPGLEDPELDVETTVHVQEEDLVYFRA